VRTMLRALIYRHAWPYQAPAGRLNFLTTKKDMDLASAANSDVTGVIPKTLARVSFPA
jgi:hypothetical protein